MEGFAIDVIGVGAIAAGVFVIVYMIGAKVVARGKKLAAEAEGVIGVALTTTKTATAPATKKTRTTTAKKR